MGAWLKQGWNFFAAYRDCEEGTPLWKSKATWVCVLGFISFLTAKYLGVELPVDVRDGLIAFIMALAANSGRKSIGSRPHPDNAEKCTEEVREDVPKNTLKPANKPASKPAPPQFKPKTNTQTTTGEGDSPALKTTPGRHDVG